MTPDFLIRIFAEISTTPDFLPSLLSKLNSTYKMNLINIICSTKRAAVNKFLKLSNFENIESSFYRLMEKSKPVNETFSLKSSLTLTLSDEIREFQNVININLWSVALILSSWFYQIYESSL